MNSNTSPNDAAAVVEQRKLAVQQFHKRMTDLGFKGFEKKWSWYHTVDLGDGIETPGVYDYRPLIQHFHFPENMGGMEVLDVGSATGYFAFEFERRGARVVSIELPSVAAWDMPEGHDREQTIIDLMRHHQVDTPEELYYYHLDGPFQFCRQWLKSRVERVLARIYDLSSELLGHDAFDLIFLGDILLHLFSPLAALSRIAQLCRGTLVIAQQVPTVPNDLPVMIYLGGDRRAPFPSGDNRTWWHPNRLCLEQMLKRLGFSAVDCMGEFQVMNRLDGSVTQKTVLHARKGFVSSF